MTTQITHTTHRLHLASNQQVEVTVDDFGSGSPYFLLHGGAGLPSVLSFGQRLASEGSAHVYVPTHPGFGGTLRPDWLYSIGMLAEVYVELIEQLDLRDVTVIGSSIGGWIAAEMAVIGSERISQFILMDAVGIVVEGQTITDIFQLTLDELAQRSYYSPAAFRIDPTTMTDAQKAGMAANRQALAVYGGQPSMGDPTLLKRLSRITTPTLVLWGDSDGIVSPDYGRAFATAIPNARFQLLANTGHMPQLETPDQVLAAVGAFVGEDK